MISIFIKNKIDVYDFLCKHSNAEESLFRILRKLELCFVNLKIHVIVEYKNEIYDSTDSYLLVNVRTDSDNDQFVEILREIWSKEIEINHDEDVQIILTTDFIKI